MYPPIVHPEFTEVPVLYVKVPANGNASALASAMLLALGSPFWDRGKIKDLTFQLLCLLKQCKVKVVVLDEVNHLVDKGGVKTHHYTAAFPALLTRIRRQVPQSAQEVIFGWIRTFLLKQSSNEAAISWKTSRVTLGATECARRLRIRPDRVLYMLSSHGATASSRVTSTGRTMLAVTPSVIDSIQGKLNRKLTHRAASKIYGLSVICLR